MMDQRGRVQLRQVYVREVRLPGRRQRLSLSVWFNKEPAEVGRFVEEGAGGRDIDGRGARSRTVASGSSW